MHYQITHTITYTYSQPVVLYPHTVRLRPRSDSSQMLRQFFLEVSPEPIGRSEVTELDGNCTYKLWFDQTAVDQLQVKATSWVDTRRTNPFNYLLEDWAMQLPIDYPLSLFTQLQPYLRSGEYAMVDGVITQLAQEIQHSVAGKTDQFLTELNQCIYTSCEYLTREVGDPLPPGITWSQKAGSCRDLTVLFVAVCRAAGLAARFVSGYQEGDPDNPDRHLHAWAEAYLPGAGWRGFDPTHGLAVSDRHVALVASPYPRYTAPLPGVFLGRGVSSEMSYEVSIQSIVPPIQQQQQMRSLSNQG